MQGIVDFYTHNAPEHRVHAYEIKRTDNQNLYASLLTQIFNENRDLAGIITTDASAHFIAEYIQTKKKQTVKVVGYDAVKINIPYIENGSIDFVISQNPQKQGYESIMTLYKSLMLNETLPCETIMPLEIITKENIPNA